VAPRKLTDDELDELASRPGARRLAVVNFLFSIPPSATLARMRANLELDTGLYQWNAETVCAIREGLRRAFKPATR